MISAGGQLGVHSYFIYSEGKNLFDKGGTSATKGMFRPASAFN